MEAVVLAAPASSSQSYVACFVPCCRCHTSFCRCRDECRCALQSKDDPAHNASSALPSCLAEYKEFEETAAALPSGMPALLDRAEAADAHWVSRVTGLRDSTTPTSFRGLYAAAYRRFSAIAHPTNLGLNPVTVDLDGSHKRVQLEERPPEMHEPFGLATIVFAP
jgi:hypothetical protein